MSTAGSVPGSDQSEINPNFSENELTQNGSVAIGDDKLSKAGTEFAQSLSSFIRGSFVSHKDPVQIPDFKFPTPKKTAYPGQKITTEEELLELDKTRGTIPWNKWEEWKKGLGQNAARDTTGEA